MAGGKIWTNDEKQLLIDCYSMNMEADAIAERLNRSRQSVWKQAHRMGIATKNGPQPFTFTESQKASIEHDYFVALKSANEIGREHDVSPKVIRNHISSVGKARNLQKANQLLNKERERVISFSELYDLYFNKCYSLRALQRHFGCGYSTLMKNFERHGIARITRNERKRMHEEFKDTGKQYNRIADWSERL